MYAMQRERNGRERRVEVKRESLTSNRACKSYTKESGIQIKGRE
jgi:hypothetical protein